MAASNWPTINIGNVTYHPILHNEEITKEIEKRGNTKQIPWIWPFQKIVDYRNCAVTSTGNILSTTSSDDDLHGLEITRPNGKCSLFGVFFSKKYICCFASDENDIVYIVTEIPSRNGNVQAQYKLLTFDVNGNAVAERSLDIIEKLMYPQMTVHNGKLVIYCWRIKGMYIGASKDGEGDCKFPLPLKNVCPGDIEAPSFTVSNNNEIIYTFSKYSDDKSFVIYIITIEDELKCDVQVPATTYLVYSINVVFNHVNKTILVSLHSESENVSESDDASSDSDDASSESDDASSESDDAFSENDNQALSNSISLLTFSKTGELLEEFKIHAWSLHKLTSHPNGTIALVNWHRVMMLQM